MAQPKRESNGRLRREVVLSVESVAVTYKVHEDRDRASLKGAFANGFRRPRLRRVEAVRDVSFQLHEGETLGLIGLNGSGKSSLLKAVAGLLPAQRGHVRARSEPVLLGIGAALQPRLSGRRNVYLGGTALGLSRDAVAAKFEEIVEFAGVGDFIEMPLRAYSSGMNSRLRFAIAASVKPDILLIDEALAVGDAAFKAKAESRIRELVSQAGALVLVSHSLKSIEEMCSRTVWLDKGVVRKDGPTREVLADYREFTAMSGA